MSLMPVSGDSDKLRRHHYSDTLASTLRHSNSLKRMECSRVYEAQDYIFPVMQMQMTVLSLNSKSA